MLTSDVALSLNDTPPEGLNSRFAEELPPSWRCSPAAVRLEPFPEFDRAIRGLELNGESDPFFPVGLEVKEIKTNKYMRPYNHQYVMCTNEIWAHKNI